MKLPLEPQRMKFKLDWLLDRREMAGKKAEAKFMKKYQTCLPYFLNRSKIHFDSNSTFL